jgi:hypothetical protein
MAYSQAQCLIIFDSWYSLHMERFKNGLGSAGEELQEIMSILQYISNYLQNKMKIEYSVLSIIYFAKNKKKLCETPIKTTKKRQKNKLSNINKH